MSEKYECVKIECINSFGKNLIYGVFRRGSHRIIRKYPKTFLPYFYVPVDTSVNINHDIVKIERVNVKTIDGKDVKKLYFRNIKALKEYRDRFAITYEDDVKFVSRFIIDKKIKFTRNYRYIYLDIETENCLDISAPKPILSICIWDSFIKKYIIFVWHEKQELIDKSNNNVIYRVFPTERGMIEDFIRYIEKNWPDIIMGWNVDRFDMPYIVNRLKRLNFDINRLSQLNITLIVYDSFEERETVQIFGTYILDLIKMYKKVIYYRPSDYSLETVAEFTLNKNVKLDIGDIVEAWKERPNEFIKYNIKDVELCHEIDKARGLLDYFLLVQHVVPCDLDDIRKVSLVVDYYLLQYYHDRYVFPSKRRKERARIKGAFVMESIPGFYNDVLVIDFKQMYPNIYISCNISPDTLDPNGKIIINKYRFKSKEEKIGLIPSCMQSLIDIRNKIKKQRDEQPIDSVEYKRFDAIQNRYKEICNSLYGTMGYEGFRLFNPDVANAITFVGRTLIQECIKKVKSLGHLPIYSDTDSIFIALKNIDNLDLKEKIRYCYTLCNNLNDIISNIMKEKFNVYEHSLRFEVQRFFEALILPKAKYQDRGVKKRYCGKVIYDDGQYCDYIYARGFEIMRKDTPYFLKKYLNNIYRMILERKTGTEIKKYIKEIMDDIKTKKPFDLGISISINKDFDKYTTTIPMQVRAAMYSNQYLSTNFSKDNIGRLLYVKRIKGKPNVFMNKPVNVIMIDRKTDISNIEIDYKTYINKLIYDKLMTLLDIADINITDQTRLQEF